MNRKRVVTSESNCYMFGILVDVTKVNLYERSLRHYDSFSIHFGRMMYNIQAAVPGKSNFHCKTCFLQMKLINSFN